MQLTPYKILLGSNSPRRKELLEKMDLKFKTIDLNADETYPDILPPTEVPEYLALKKSLVYESLKDNELLITADTIVVLNDLIIGKPKNKTQAKKMLKSLSGKKHQVITGVCLRTHKDVLSFSDISEVHFKKLKSSEIDYYIEHYKPFDKAGGYGIQEWIGVIGIKRIKGSFYNIMGLPTAKLVDYLRECK
ncbi:MAG TPA: septum formation protein Maf [Flavobacteriales bacterium]|jgi:septum formation protein|nr:septum formation protein Maf [Flavobacteriales bacterium]